MVNGLVYSYRSPSSDGDVNYEYWLLSGWIRLYIDPESRLDHIYWHFNIVSSFSTITRLMKAALFKSAICVACNSGTCLGRPTFCPGSVSPDGCLSVVSRLPEEALNHLYISCYNMPCT